MAAGLLADQGAQVIKVELRPGDMTRLIGPGKVDSSALFAPERQGAEQKRKQKIKRSMLDAAVAFLSPEAFYNHAFLNEPPPDAPEFGANHKLWRCHDGWLAMITPQIDEFAAMCRVLGVADLITNPRFTSIPARRLQQAPLRERLEPIVAQRGVDALAAELGAAGVPAGRVNSKAALALHPQVQHNTLLCDTLYPALDRLRTPRAAARFIGMPPNGSAPAPGLGEHSRSVLLEMGRGGAEVEALFACGAVG